ncbi:MAG: DUF2798 domain-containing protein [bacterium]|nr:DUF2798 domain-containing protein [bacterium]
MPKNRQEGIVFGFLMCFFMVLGMSIYVMLWQHGWTPQVITEAWLGLPLSFIVAFTLDELVVNKPAKVFAHKFLMKDSTPHWRKILAMTLSMVVPMVILMSLYGSIIAVTHGAPIDAILPIWGLNILRNFPAAMVVNLAFAGPIARTIFGWIFRKEQKDLEKLAEEEA